MQALVRGPLPAHLGRWVSSRSSSRPRPQRWPRSPAFLRIYATCWPGEVSAVGAWGGRVFNGGVWRTIRDRRVDVHTRASMWFSMHRKPKRVDSTRSRSCSPAPAQGINRRLVSRTDPLSIPARHPPSRPIWVGRVVAAHLAEHCPGALHGESLLGCESTRRVRAASRSSSTAAHRCPCIGHSEATASG